MSEQILDFEKAEHEAGERALVSPWNDSPTTRTHYLQDALEAQAQAAVARWKQRAEAAENQLVEAKVAQPARWFIEEGLTPLRAEHQRLKDAVAGTTMALRGCNRQVGSDYAEFNRLVREHDAACAALAAFEAQHPEVRG